MHSFRQEANNQKVLIVIINNNNNISFIIITIRSWVLYCDKNGIWASPQTITNVLKNTLLQALKILMVDNSASVFLS